MIERAACRFALRAYVTVHGRDRDPVGYRRRPRIVILIDSRKTRRIEMAAIAGRAGGSTVTGPSRRTTRQQKLIRKMIAPASMAHAGLTGGYKSFAAKPMKQTRVLIAEDEDRIRNRAALQLTRSGMRVKKVGAPGRLDILLDSFKPDVLILDDHLRAATPASPRSSRTSSVDTLRRRSSSRPVSRKPISHRASGRLHGGLPGSWRRPGCSTSLAPCKGR